MIDSKPWLQPGRWHAAPAYWDDEALELRKNMPKRVRFIDCTMPEGDDCVGHQLNWITRLGLIQRLDAIGIDAITLPSHSKLAEEEDLARAYRRLGLKAEMIVKGPGIRFPMEVGDWRKVVDNSLAMEPDVLCPAALWPYEDTANDFSGNLTLDEVVETVQEVIIYAKAHGAKVVPWIGDTMRGSTRSACAIARGMVEAGADGVYLVDSRGNSHPIATRVLVRKVREAIGEQARLYVQHHNDLGVATANALADAESGADWIDCTVLGIGDRGGTVAFEEAACLFEMYGIETNIDLAGLYDLCCYVRDAFGVALPAWKPIAGDNWNKEEGKGHLEGAAFSEASFGLAPEVVGRKMEMVIGGKILFGKERSSLWTDDPVFVKGVLADWGLTVNQTQLDRIILRAQAAVATTRPRFYLTFNEFRTIVDGVL